MATSQENIGILTRRTHRNKYFEKNLDARCASWYDTCTSLSFFPQPKHTLQVRCRYVQVQNSAFKSRFAPSPNSWRRTGHVADCALALGAPCARTAIRTRALDRPARFKRAG